MTHPPIILALVLLVSGEAVAELKSISCGLDPLNPDVRKKIPVLIYIGNDIRAPYPQDGVVQNLLYIESALQGEQFYTRPSQGVFTDEEIASYKRLPEKDQQFLASVGEQVRDDLSQMEGAFESECFEATLWRRNPKYRGGLVIFRNFASSNRLRKEFPKYTWRHCMPLSEKDSTMFQPQVDTTPLADTLWRFPYNEQPLTHRAFMEHRLAEVFEIYSPKEHRFILVVDSNTWRNEVLSPRFGGLWTSLPVERFRQAVIDNHKLFVDDQGALRRDRSFFQALNQSALDADENLKRAEGISFAAFMEMLGERFSDSQFPLVAFTTNAIDVSELEREKLTNVGSVIYSADSSPAFEVVEWNQLEYFVGVTETDLEDRVKTVLLTKPLARPE